MPNIINPNCPSLPQQVEKNTQDILKLFASNLEELSGLEFNPTSIIYQQDKAIISGKFIVTRDEASTEIDGVVTIPIIGENGIVVDGSEDNLKIRIALDQSDRELFNFVQELVNRTTESDEIVFTSDMENYVENFVSEATEKMEEIEVVYDASSLDINLNWGYTAGITDGTVFSKDLSKYKKLIFYFNNYPNGGICEIDNRVDTHQNMGQGILYSTQNEQGYLYVYLFRVKKTGNSYGVSFLRYRQNDANTNTDGIIYKIEGVITND